jgi:hypothetical protein
MKVRLLPQARERAKCVAVARVTASVSIALVLMSLRAHAQETWTCDYIANTRDSPLQITSTFRVEGDTLREIETIPEGLNFHEKYAVLENNDDDIVAAISLAKFGPRPPPGIGAVVIIIGKRNGMFEQSGAILGMRVGPPTLGRCAKKASPNDNSEPHETSGGDEIKSSQSK